MARPESLLRASDSGVVSELAVSGLPRDELRELHPESHTDDPAQPDASEAVDLLDDSPTLRLRDAVSDDQLPASPDTVPAGQRFAAWSRRYLTLVATADAMVGGIAAAVPASISDTLSGKKWLPLLLCLIGSIVWPAAIALCRGYRRNRIGIGFDEPGAVMRAGMVLVVACAVPTGLMAVPTGTLDPTGSPVLTMYALLKLVATGTPFAVLLSLIVRFLARKVLHYLQRRGRSMRHVIVVGSFTAARQLSEHST